MICEILHYKNGEYLGKENTELEPEEIVNDVWHQFLTTNDIMVELPDGTEIGEFDYYFKALETIKFNDIVKMSILDLDIKGLFN